MIWYVPLEQLEERYTAQLARPNSGWVERYWVSRDIPYRRIEVEMPEYDQIRTGTVLDACRRSVYAMAAVAKILQKIEEGEIQDGDVLFFDDFWHPGIEAIPYLCSQKGIKLKMYAFCYAQSVDAYDFTFPMRPWIRPFERALFSLYDGIFVANTLLKNLIVTYLNVAPERVHVTGLIYSSYEALHTLGKKQVTNGFIRPSESDRGNTVVFSSRLDREKRPSFFLFVVDYIMERRSDINFVICSSQKTLRTNDPEILMKIEESVFKYDGNLQVCANLRKVDYYSILQASKVQFNCALQDWVSFTLLEAVTMGCIPVYPRFRSFPETFGETITGSGPSPYLYDSGPNEVQKASELIMKMIDEGVSNEEFGKLYDQTAGKHNRTMRRITTVLQTGQLPEGMETYA